MSNENGIASCQARRHSMDRSTWAAGSECCWAAGFSCGQTFDFHAIAYTNDLIAPNRLCLLCLLHVRLSEAKWITSSLVHTAMPRTIYNSWLLITNTAGVVVEYPLPSCMLRNFSNHPLESGRSGMFAKLISRPCESPKYLNI